MRAGLTEKQLNIIIEVLMAYSFIDEAVLFGSRATGNFKSTSDIDIALKGSMGDDQLAKVKQELQEEVMIPLFFDLVNYCEISNEALIREIDEKGIIIYKKGTPEKKEG